MNALEYIERNSTTEPNTGCWLWLLLGDVGGYGRAKHSGRRLLAHRLSWEASNGPIPDGFDVCHRCDTPLCVNPTHLFLGTHRENMADMATKGRCKSARGSRCGNAKLTESDAAKILSSPLPDAWMARHFGVSKAAVGAIRSGRTWTHVEAKRPTRYIDGRVVRHMKPDQVEQMAGFMADAA